MADLAALSAHQHEIEARGVETSVNKLRKYKSFFQVMSKPGWHLLHKKKSSKMSFVKLHRLQMHPVRKEDCTAAKWCFSQYFFSLLFAIPSIHLLQVLQNKTNNTITLEKNCADAVLVALCA